MLPPSADEPPLALHYIPLWLVVIVGNFLKYADHTGAHICTILMLICI